MPVPPPPPPPLDYCVRPAPLACAGGPPAPRLDALPPAGAPPAQNPPPPLAAVDAVGGDAALAAAILGAIRSATGVGGGGGDGGTPTPAPALAAAVASADAAADAAAAEDLFSLGVNDRGLLAGALPSESRLAALEVARARAAAAAGDAYVLGDAVGGSRVPASSRQDAFELDAVVGGGEGAVFDDHHRGGGGRGHHHRRCRRR